MTDCKFAHVQRLGNLSSEIINAGSQKEDVSTALPKRLRRETCPHPPQKRLFAMPTHMAGGNLGGRSADSRWSRPK